jgi:regulator of sigma E protease
LHLLLALVILGVLVTFHELGHFIAAKLVGVHIHEFGIGFGPVILSKRINGTLFSLRLIPVGGFNRFAGEEGPGKEEDETIPHEKMLSAQSPGRRSLVIMGGPFFNLVIAAVAFFAVFSLVGISQATTTIAEIMPGYPAEAAGLLPGDKIVSVDGRSTPTWEDMVLRIQAKSGVPISVEVLRNGSTLDFHMVPIEVNNVGVIGVRPSIVTLKTGALKGLTEGIRETIAVSAAWIKGILGMIVGSVPPDVTGPVGITQLLGEAARLGLGQLLYITGIFSANLALFNLMPFPALDGSRLVFNAIEAIRGKPIAPEKEGFVHFLGFFFLMALFVFVTYKDIVRLVR